MTLIISPSLAPGISPLAIASEVSFPAWADRLIETIGENLGTSVLNLVRGILILFVGWIIAGILRRITKTLLDKTHIDNQIAAWIVGEQEGKAPPIEKWVAEFVYWLVILFAIIAALEALELQQVSQPLQSLLNEVTSFLPQVGGAAVLLGAAWLLATLVRLIVGRALRTLRIDERLGQQTGEEGTFSLADTIGNTLYWFIFLLFLPSILSTLRLEGTLVPVQQLLNQLLAMLPNILGAVLIGFSGWLVAQVIRRVVTNLLAATGTDRFGAKFGLTGQDNAHKLSWILGTTAYLLILLPVAIAALNALKIEAISGPAIAMLEDILAVLPQIFTAAVVLILAYVAGSYLADLVTSLLTSIGFNHVMEWLGFAASPAPEPTVENFPENPDDPQATVLQTPEIKAPTRTPSELLGTIVLIGVMLVATLAAVDILAIDALTALVSGIVVIAGQVLVGVVVFVIGLYLANFAFNLITSSGNRQAQIAGHAARIAIIIFVSAMALRQMGIAPDIVNLAFGLLGGAIAVAVAIAFGLGSRDIAAEQVRGWIDDFKRQD
ncbi:MAG: hypothetical protein EA366_06905 [Spirulina sp. DLM2.Bin59]|nr:MAG: hypothetical protein EA366_06905 [Spirulina sp. DLM2.Bin59]